MSAIQILLAFTLGTVFGVFVMGMIRMARRGEDDPEEFDPATAFEVEQSYRRETFDRHRDSRVSVPHVQD